jgi:hypothetical protein
MTRKPVIALVITSVLSLGAAATLSGVTARNADEAEAEETRTGEMLDPTPDALTSPTWLLSDFSWL